MVNSLIAGIYGMNFAHMPELAWGYGYYFALGLMVIASSTVFVLFRRMGWLRGDDMR
jgi:magnesium transporter